MPLQKFLDVLATRTYYAGWGRSVMTENDDGSIHVKIKDCAFCDKAEVDPNATGCFVLGVIQGMIDQLDRISSCRKRGKVPNKGRWPLPHRNPAGCLRLQKT